MRKNAKVLSLILAGAMAMSLAGCSGSGSKDSTKETAAKSEAKEAGAESSGQETSKAAGAGEADASGETYQIGVLQLVQHDALDAANKGFSPPWTRLVSIMRQTSRMPPANRPIV